MIQDANNSFKEKDYNLARQLYSVLINIEPNNSEYLGKRAYCYKKSMFYQKSLNDYNLAILNAKDEHNHYSNRGELYLDLKKYDEAIGDYSIAIKLSNSLIPKYFNNRGWANLKLGKKKESCDDFSKSASMNYQLAKDNLKKYCE